jgi:hypothetical protein
MAIDEVLMMDEVGCGLFSIRYERGVQFLGLHCSMWSIMSVADPFFDCILESIHSNGSFQK